MTAKELHAHPAFAGFLANFASFCGAPRAVFVGQLAAALTEYDVARGAREKELEEALRDLAEEYDGQRAQYGSEYIWRKYEDVAVRERAIRVLEGNSSQRFEYPQIQKEEV